MSTGNTRESHNQSMPPDKNERHTRRQRLALSCTECRRQKLSCDRTWPCQRCVRAGRRQECLFSTPTGQPPAPNSVGRQERRQQQRQTQPAISNEIHRLKVEVADLKALLTRSSSSTQALANSEAAIESAARPELSQPERYTERLSSAIQSTPPSKPAEVLLQGSSQPERYTESLSLATQSTPRSKPAELIPQSKSRFQRGYYFYHALFRFFVEIPQLFPFVIETTDEWLKPIGIILKKAKSKKEKGANAVPATRAEGLQLESILPPQEDTDALVALYLDHFEHIHRIVHVPTFRRDYAAFWESGSSRSPAMVVLVLSMIAASTCVSEKDTLRTKHRDLSTEWISTCDMWIRQQSPKHRRLIWYQNLCLVYLAKRLNVFHKKQFWTETGSLLHDAVMGGLNCDPSGATDSPYMIEMKRRIWHVIRELDLQNAFEFGLPTLLHSIDSNVAAPVNLDDEDIDEASAAIPAARPASQFTRTSYQCLSARSWGLRLEVSRRLYSRGSSNTLSYDDVLRYTNELTQAMCEIPGSGSETDTSGHDGNDSNFVLAHAFMQFQLKECILALHRPYLEHADSKFWISENVCHHMSRDILLLHLRLGELGVQGPAQLREDLLLASLTIARITMLQSSGSDNVIASTSSSTVELLEQCLPMVEDRYLRCSDGEPWCFFTMCAALMLVKIQLGRDYWYTAKFTCAQRFLDLYNRRLGRKLVSLTNEHQQLKQPITTVRSAEETVGSGQQALMPSNTVMPSSVWQDASVLDSTLVPSGLDIDMDLDSMWDSIWETA